MCRWLLPIVAFTLIAGAGFGRGAGAQEATPASGPALGRTNVRYALPYTANGLNPALNVPGRDTGTCDIPSAASAGRPDAWRCISTGALDPCYENPFDAVEPPIDLACMVSPWSRDVVLFTTTAPLPRQKEVEMANAPPPPPWALELATGEQCEILTGATAAYAGMRINYGCTGQGSIIGEPDRSQPVWVVNYLPPDGLATELVAVTTAWI